MKKWIIGLGLIVAIVSCNSSETKKTQERFTIKSEKIYHGLIWGDKRSDKKLGLNWNFGTLVIRNRDAFDTFIKRIPKSIPSKGPRRANENKDPLLSDPKIDFSKKMMLVGSADNWYTRLLLKNIYGYNGAIYMGYRIIETEGTYLGQRPLGLGRYLAVVIPRSKKTVMFKGVLKRFDMKAWRRKMNEKRKK